MAGKVYFLEKRRIKVEEIKEGFYIMYSNMYGKSMTVCKVKTEEERDKKIKEIKSYLGKKSLDEIFNNHK